MNESIEKDLLKEALISTLKGFIVFCEQYNLLCGDVRTKEC